MLFNLWRFEVNPLWEEKDLVHMTRPRKFTFHCSHPWTFQREAFRSFSRWDSAKASGKKEKIIVEDELSRIVRLLRVSLKREDFCAFKRTLFESKNFDVITWWLWVRHVLRRSWLWFYLQSRFPQRDGCFKKCCSHQLLYFLNKSTGNWKNYLNCQISSHFNR